GDDGGDERVEGMEDGGHGVAAIRLGLGLAEDLPDFAARVMETPGELPNAQLVNAVGVSDTCIFVHSDHPPPPCSWTLGWYTSLQEVVGGGPILDEDSCWGWVRFRRGLPATRKSTSQGPRAANN